MDDHTLPDAIAEVRRVFPADAKYTPQFFSEDQAPCDFDIAICTIANAILNGQLVTLADLDAAVGAVLAEAAELANEGKLPLIAEQCCDAILALRPDATAALRRALTRAREVKPLVWEQYCPSSGNSSAEAFGGEYICERAGPDGHFGLWYPGDHEASEPRSYHSEIEAAALIRAKDAEIARLVAERGAAREHRADAEARMETAEAALATERTARLAAEKRMAELAEAVKHERKLREDWHRMVRSGRDPGEEAEVALEKAYDDVSATLTKEKPHG